MMLLLAPLGLLALFALVIPFVLHLVRRQQLTDTEFAALRWISLRTQPQRHLRIERPWLLLLRLLLLALLALLLAQPVLESKSVDRDADWVVVAPGADLAAARSRIGGAGEWRWLAPGFPSLDAQLASAPTPTASLLRELDAQLPAGRKLSLVVPEQLDGLDGERVQLAHAFDWIVVPGQSPAVATMPAEKRQLFVRFDADQAAGLDYLRAAVAAWNVRVPACCTLDAQSLATPLPADARWLVWLGADLPADVTAWVEQGGVALVAPQAAKDGDANVLWRDRGGTPLAYEHSRGAGRLISLSGRLDPAQMPLLLDDDFAQRLFDALRGPTPAPTRASAAAVEPLHAAAAAASDVRQVGRALRAFDPWLALLISALLLAERWLATRRRRGART